MSTRHTFLPHQGSLAKHGAATDIGLAQESSESHYTTPVDTGSSIGRGSKIPTYPSNSSGPSSTTTASTLDIRSSFREVESMKSKIRQLEEQLSNSAHGSTQSPATTANSNIETTTSRLGGTFHIHHDSRIFGQSQATSRSVMHKSRLFGQSHWVNGIVLVRPCAVIGPRSLADWSLTTSSSKISSNCSSPKCGKRHQKHPPAYKSAKLWQRSSNRDEPLRGRRLLSLTYHQKRLPTGSSQATFERARTVYRILHIPTFQREYEALWVPDNLPDAVFLVQLKLVLAIGAYYVRRRFLPCVLRPFSGYTRPKPGFRSPSSSLD